MFTHPYTKEPLEFKSQEELLDFLSRLNPLYMRDFKNQYSAKYPTFEILDFGKNVEIRKIKNKR
jgi:hypothetical protein